MNELMLSTLLHLLQVVLSFKHGAYVHEGEFRLLETHRMDQPPEVNIRTRLGTEVRYREFDWRSRVPAALVEIRIGPAAAFEAATQFTKDCLPAVPGLKPENHPFDHSPLHRLVWRTKREHSVITSCMSVARCAVSFSDADGITHTARVQAESLYEAVALAVAEFRQDQLVPPLASMTEFTVAIERPAIEHRIRLAQVSKWAESSTREGPAGIMKRQKVRALLAS